MFSKLIAGSVVALSVGQTYATGYAWSGVNMGGFDFGCDTTGACLLDNVVAPLSQYKGQDGAGQMKHFVDDDGFNAFRLPVGWQFLVNNKVGGTLDSTAMTQYDALVQACLVTGAYCIIDIHNYARWDGEIIGQGGPEDADFASLWSQLAKKYAKDAKVVMGIVNEPHDIPDLTMWATTVQAAVTAIRKAGATDHTILLPGTGYTSAESFVSSGSGPALAKVKNLDGSTDNLVFDVHKYLDEDNSGTHPQCTGNDTNVAFEPLATWLRQEKRQALLSEIGGGSSNPSCMTFVCEVADYLNENSDVYLGMLGWAAGSFDDTYILSLGPTKDGSTWTDKPLLTKCFAEKFQGGSGVTTPSNTTSGGGSETGGSSTAVGEAPASSQTQYLGGILPHLTGTIAAQSFASTPAATPSQGADGLGGGYNHLGGGVATPASTTSPTSSSSSSPGADGLGGGYNNLGGGVTQSTPTTSPTLSSSSSSSSSSPGAGGLGGGYNNLGGGVATSTPTTSPTFSSSSLSSTTSAIVQLPTGARMPIPIGAISSYGFHNSSSIPGPTGTGAEPSPITPLLTTTTTPLQPTTMQTVVRSSAVPSGVTEEGEGDDDECEWVEE